MASDAAFKICPACSARAQLDHRFCPSCGNDLTDVPVDNGDPYLTRVIAEKYRLVALLGEGAMGRVYRAEQIPLGKPFAVKILAPHLMHDEASHARFANEAHNAANLNHPNCVSVVDYGRTGDGLTYIVMEFVEGRTLEWIINEHYPLPRERVVDLTLQILAALTEAHGLGILHRDLKPENILVQQLRTHGELAKVVDFGIAKLMDGAPGNARPGLTSQGMVCGTPEYMSPEQARGQTLDPRSDLYAVGCVLYQFLTQHPPFESSSAVEILHRHLHEEPIPPSKLLGQAPDPLEDVCMRALSKNPDERFASAVEFREALIRASTGPSAAQPPSATVPCGSCGADMRPGDRFCAACGSSAPNETRKTAHMAVHPRRKRHPTRRSGLSIPMQGDRERTAEVVVRNFPLPLVGRDQLFEDSRAMLANPEGGLQAKLLRGPSGAGKTRLADEIAAMAEQLGWRVFYVGADPTGAAVSLWPVQLMVGQLLDLDPFSATTQDLGRAANLSGVAFEELPGLAELFSLDGPAHDIEYQVRKRECSASAISALLHGGLGQPLLLVFDDVDGYDAASRDIMRRLAKRTSESPVIFLATTSEDDTAWFAGDTIDLEPLPADAVEEACRQVTLGVSPGSALPSKIADAGPTTPLLLELRLRLMAAGVEFEAGADDAALIQARLHALAPEARQLVECASILGERFPENDLIELATRDPGAPMGDVDEVLAQLHVGGLLLITGRGERAFSHARIFEVARAGIERERAARLHQFVADHSRIAKVSEPVRAVHLMLAGNKEAAAALEAAADFAERRFDDRSAHALHKAAMRALERRRSPDLAAQARIAEKLGRVMRDKSEAKASLALLERQLEQPHAPDDMARLHQARGRHLMRVGRYQDAMGEFQKALGPTIAGGERQRMLGIYSELAQVHVRLGGWKRALAELEEGLDMCTLGEGPRAEIDLDLWRYLLGVATTLRAAGRLTEARSWCGHALFQAERRDDRLGMLRVHSQLAWILRELDQQLLAEQHLARALEEARHFGDRLSTAELLIERARARAGRGKIADARRCCEEALRLAVALDWRAGVRHAERALEMLASDQPVSQA